MGKTQSLCHNSPIWRKRAAIIKKPGQEICKQDQLISAFCSSGTLIKEREWVKLTAGNKVFFKCWKSAKLIPKAKNLKFAEIGSIHGKLMMIATIWLTIQEQQGEKIVECSGGNQHLEGRLRFALSQS